MRCNARQGLLLTRIWDIVWRNTLAACEEKGSNGMLIFLYHADAVWWCKDECRNVCKEFSTTVKGNIYARGWRVSVLKVIVSEGLIFLFPDRETGNKETNLRNAVQSALLVWVFRVQWFLKRLLWMGNMLEKHPDTWRKQKGNGRNK